MIKVIHLVEMAVIKKYQSGFILEHLFTRLIQSINQSQKLMMISLEAKTKFNTHCC